MATHSTHISYCVVPIVCTDVQSALRKRSSITIQEQVSKEALKEGEGTMRALVCTGLTAGLFIGLIVGSPLFLVFAFVLPWQLIAAVADPDGRKEQ
ncbi:hypothetical protein LTY59_06880 [Limosilactobacillus balticus]|uniref:Uncharacterized protein n=1 Tax=Limosilactobacillus balticus TaxID=2759747 RepID=A0ABS8RI21_9LACO|nr:hypothetical protein [Limosilactobacillus balticus]MCD7138944.1 hypothetical protein [Limosilactobacillus balticus]